MDIRLKKGGKPVTMVTFIKPRAEVWIVDYETGSSMILKYHGILNVITSSYRNDVLIWGMNDINGIIEYVETLFRLGCDDFKPVNVIRKLWKLC